MKKESHFRSIVENTTLMLVTATALMKGIDTIALDSQPLLPSNHFWWAVDPEAKNPNCFDATIISIHTVTPGEHVSLHIQSFMNNKTVAESLLDLSGRSVTINHWDGICLPSSASPRGIIFSAVNGNIQGKQSIYVAP